METPGILPGSGKSSSRVIITGGWAARERGWRRIQMTCPSNRQGPRGMSNRYPAVLYPAPFDPW